MYAVLFFSGGHCSFLNAQGRRLNTKSTLPKDVTLVLFLSFFIAVQLIYNVKLQVYDIEVQILKVIYSIYNYYKILAAFLVPYSISCSLFIFYVVSVPFTLTSLARLRPGDVYPDLPSSISPSQPLPLLSHTVINEAALRLSDTAMPSEKHRRATFGQSLQPVFLT